MKLKKAFTALCLTLCLTLSSVSVGIAAELPNNSAQTTQAGFAAMSDDPVTERILTSNKEAASDSENTSPSESSEKPESITQNDTGVTESNPQSETDIIESDTPSGDDIDESNTPSDNQMDESDIPSDNDTPDSPPADQTTAETEGTGVIVPPLKGTESGTGEIESDGWKTDTALGKSYYIKNGVRLLGWQVIDSKKYYLGGDGYRVSGLTVIEGKTYYFDVKNNDAMSVGQVSIDTKQYYFDTDGIMKTGFINVSGKVFYYNADGTLLIGNNAPYKIGNTLYFIKSTGETAVNAWNTANGKKYYSNGNGALVTGFQTLPDKKRYYFNSDGSLTIGKNAAIQISGKWYFITTSGEIKTNGWNTDSSKKKYYSNPDGTLVTKTVKKIGKYYYGFNVSMYADKIATINGHKYLFKSNGAARTSSINTYKGKKYYSDKYGRIKIGLFKHDSNKKLYFSDKYGRIKTGRFTYSGKSYYSNSNGQLYTGWVKYRNKTYYYDTKKGNMAKGWMTRGSKKYYLGTNGVRQTSWLKLNNKYYYFNPSGVMQKGWELIGNKWYYLDSKSGVMKKGWLNLNGKYYYLDKKDGDMKKGWLNLGSKTYYLDGDGVRTTGWFTNNAKKYYFDKDGVMYKGVHTIDGKRYDFGASGGINLMTTGKITIKVNRAANCITVYADNVPVKAIICSTGSQVGMTPLGNFTIMDKLRWHELDGPSWGQYCSHITPEILFHSAPVTKKNDPNSLPWATYMQLGRPASHGCIRLTVADAKWLYDNCPVGTSVIIYDDANNPGPLGKPALIPMPGDSSHDPTDPAFQ